MRKIASLFLELKEEKEESQKEVTRLADLLNHQLIELEKERKENKTLVRFLVDRVNRHFVDSVD